jgi:hypothetical protein
MKRLPWIAAAAVLAVCLAGCLKRKETITIAQDGRVAVELEYKGGTGDVENGDAMPSAASGWQIEVRKEITGEDNGEPTEDTIIEGSASFAPGEQLPFTYADPYDPDFELYLQFPTTLTVERRADGLYYHFRRIYPARRYAYVDNFYRAHVKDDLEKIERKSDRGEELTRDERRQQIEAAVAVELNKMRVFATQAFQNTTPDAPQDCWLKTWEGFQRLAESIDSNELLDLVERIRENEDDDAAGEALAARAEELQAQAMDTYLNGLEEYCGYDQRQRETFLRLYAQAKKEYDITEDLMDDAFEITVVMPGRLVAANSTKRDGEHDVTWEFEGSEFFDADVVLMATSMVPYEAPEPEAEAEAETALGTGAGEEADR